MWMSYINDLCYEVDIWLLCQHYTHYTLNKYHKNYQDSGFQTDIYPNNYLFEL